MATTVLFNGVSYSVPNTGDDGWGESLTSYFVAISTGALQKTGGVFSITADINFGASFGLISNYFKSRTANIATVGVLRLANTDTIAFRNFGLGGNLTIGVNASDKFVFSADIVANISGTATNVTGVVTEVHGGTNQSSYTLGDTLYASATDTLSKLPAGTPGQLLMQGATVPEWGDVVSEVHGGTNQTGYTQGDILYASATDTLSKLAKGAPGQVLSQTATIPSWASVQAGTKNYLSSYVASTSSNVPNPGNGNFETGSTAGWSLAHSTLSGVTPTDAATPGSAFSSASGGSAADVTLTLGTVTGGSQLDSNYSGDLESSGASVAGDLLISDAFFIDQSDQAKVQAVNFSYKLASGTGLDFSGTSSNSFAVWIYDVTNAAWIQPVGVYAMIQTGGVGQVQAVFQTTANSTQYQLALININATSGAYGLYVDEFSIGPDASAGVDSGAVSLITSGPTSSITGSASDVTGWANVTKDSTASFNPTTGEYTVPVSGDYVVNANALVTGAGVTVGQYVELDILKNGTPISSGTTVAGGSVTVLNVAANSLLSCVAGDIIKLQILSNGTLTGFDAGGQYTWLNIYRLSSAPSGVNSGVIAAQVGLTSNYAATTNVIYDTVISDTNAAYSTITGLYTVPVSGYYKMSVVGLTTAAGGFVLNIIKNGVHDSYLTSISDTVFGAGSLTVKCVAGDTLGIAPNSPATFVGASAPAFLNTFTIEKISGTVTPSASDTVSAQLSLSGNTGTTANAVIILDVVRQDTTASYSPITGLFTVPISGTYEISFTGLNTLVTPIGIYVAKNGVGIMYLCSAINTSFGGGTQLISAKAGDTLGIFSDGITTLAGGSSGSIQNITYVSILRVGN